MSLIQDCSVDGACNGCPHYFVCHDDSELPVVVIEDDDEYKPF